MRRLRGIDRAFQEYEEGESSVSLEPSTSNSGGVPARDGTCLDGCCDSSNGHQCLRNNMFLPAGVDPLPQSSVKQGKGLTAVTL